LSEREVLRRILPYVPPYWVRQAFGDPEHSLVGREARIHAAVLFVDISGFTPISEALSQRGPGGVEELSAILDRYFTVMSEPVMALGGEVVKSAGDSLIVLFPVQPDGGDAHLGAALHCSLRMQRAMSEFVQVLTSAGTFPLRMKIGIGEGAIYTTTVGDEEKGMQPVFAGRPIARCMQAEDMAGAGEIVADAALVSRMPGRLDMGEARGTFRLIIDASHMPVLPPMEQVQESAVPGELVGTLVSRLAPYLPEQVVERIRQGQRGVSSEHRRVTIMFVKFGGLNYDLEPSVGKVLQAYFTTMRDCILRYGGRLNEVDIVADGGTLVVFFGAPTAHEDDELRAVSCAWEMQQAVADVRLAAGAAAERMRQSIGISSGNVFAGEVGAPVRRTYTAVGDEMNLASRLMNLAQWGEIVVASWVEKRAAGRFDFEAMGEVQLRGKTEPVPLFVLVGRRQERMQDGLLSDLMNRRHLVGRAAELAVLSTVRDQAWQGKPQLLLVTGEAGIGKSHLISQLAQGWMEKGGLVYAADSRQHGRNVPYGLWIELLRAVFGLQETNSLERRLEKIVSQLTYLSYSLSEQGKLFAELLDTNSVGPTAHAQSWSQEQRLSIRQVVIDLVRTLAQRLPLLLVLESLHDADEASLALLNDLLCGLRGTPLLLCAEYRPREQMGLAEDTIATTRMEVEALSEVDSLLLAQALLEDLGLQPGLAPQVVEQVQGNPFYLQEMISALVRFDDPAQALAERKVIPESISDMVQAQMDPLGEEFKLSVRLAAVVGQLFSFDVLQAAHPVPVSRSVLAGRLAKLERMHIVHMDHFGEDIVYRFHHPMVRRVIYASLLSADRERFHRGVGEALEHVYAGDLETRYELAADHFYDGKVLSKATSYLVLAGQQAAQAHAVREALAHYDRAEEILSMYKPPRSSCGQGVRLKLLLDRASVHLELGETAAAKQDYEDALSLAGVLGDVGSQGKALLCLADTVLWQADYQRAQVLSRQAMQRFYVLEDRRSMARSLLLSSRLSALQGHWESAERYVQQVADLEDSLEDLAGAARCKSWIGAMHLAAGRPSQALESLQRAVQLGRRSGEPTGTVEEDTLLLAQVSLYLGQWGEAIRLCREAIEASLGTGTRLDVAEARRVLALVLTRIGAYEEAVDQLDEAMTAFTDADWRVGLMSGFWIAGEALLALGRSEQAAERLQQALALGTETYTVDVIIHAQLGLGQWAGERQDWSEEHRLCTEARARARQARLDPLVGAARLCLARAYIGRQEWRPAQREALQALDLSYRLHCPYDTFLATSTLGEVLLGLGQPNRAGRHFRDAQAIMQRLADTLPANYGHCFLETRAVRAVHEYVRRHERSYRDRERLNVAEGWNA
jgi:adenylate cyclase